MSQRKKLIESIVQKIKSLSLDHPIRVGIDGVTASGKSTFAKELRDALLEQGRRCVLTTLDGFHNPKAIRYQKGRESAEGYYLDAYNYNQVIQNLLLPLGPNGNLKYRIKVHDLKTDKLVDLLYSSADSSEILVVDGSFALRKELRDHWDFKIYIKVDFEVALLRAAIRDAIFFGSAERALEMTRKRYHGAHLLHNEAAAPCSIADVIINNNNPQRPTLVI